MSYTLTDTFIPSHLSKVCMHKSCMEKSMRSNRRARSQHEVHELTHTLRLVGGSSCENGMAQTGRRGKKKHPRRRGADGTPKEPSAHTTRSALCSVLEAVLAVSSLAARCPEAELCSKRLLLAIAYPMNICCSRQNVPLACETPRTPLLFTASAASHAARPTARAEAAHRRRAPPRARRRRAYEAWRAARCRPRPEAPQRRRR